MTSQNFLSTRSARSSAAALIVGLSLGMAGCNSGDSPGNGGSSSAVAAETPTATGTPTPSPTPSAVYKPADAAGPAQNVPVPVMPELAKTETKEGLEAFTRYWFDLLNYAYQTGDVAGLESVTNPSCDYCSKLTTSLTTNYQGDRWLAGGKITTPASTTSFERSSDGNFQVILQVLQTPISYYETGGKEFRAASNGSNTGNVLIADFVDGAWRVNDLHPIR